MRRLSVRFATRSATGSRLWTPIVGLGVMLASALSIPSATASDPDALWKIVGLRCFPDQQAHHNPAPCVSVNDTGGSAVLKDISGRTQFLLIPTMKITGIESPAILAPDAPNYFAQAWAATALTRRQSGHALSRRDYALAINSARGRSQNQLHIHVDCIRPDIRAALDRVSASIGPRWHVLPIRLRLHRYRALWIDGDTLGDTNPFHLLAASLRVPAAEMGMQTLVLIGDTRHGRPGFILLDGTSGILTTTVASDIARLHLGPGSGEELEDHDCAIANDAPTLSEIAP